MYQKLLEDLYGIRVQEHQVKIGSYEALSGNDGWRYLVVRTGNRQEEDIRELAQIAWHLRSYGDTHVPVFLFAKDGKLVVRWMNEPHCVLAARTTNGRQAHKLGRKLAKFHERGRKVPFQIQRSSRIGQWKNLWEQRLEQMEKVWNGLLFQTPEDEFERMFVDSYPYYMGLTENAAQYLVDTEIDEHPAAADGGTVCHERFFSGSWGGNYLLKDPFDWVFDHRSRDLAEWTRERYFHNSQIYQLEISRFFQQYQTVVPLTTFSWRLLYARLVFPLHYFECIENYYLTRSEQNKKILEEQLAKILRQSGEYEQFLANFYQIAGAPGKGLPRLEWL